MDVSSWYANSVWVLPYTGPDTAADGRGDAQYGTAVELPCRFEPADEMAQDLAGRERFADGWLETDVDTVAGLLVNGLRPGLDVVVFPPRGTNTVTEIPTAANAANARPVLRLESQSNKDGSYTTLEVFTG